MMKRILSILFMLGILSTSVNAQNVIPADDLQMFGIAFSPIDSVMYITELQPVSGAHVYKKSKLLYNRSEYSVQLRDHLISNGIQHMTVAVISAVDHAKAEKKYLKIKQKYQNSKYVLKYLSLTDFSFQELEYESSDAEASVRKMNVKSQKRQQKEQKKREKRQKKIEKQKQKKIPAVRVANPQRKQDSQHDNDDRLKGRM